MFEVERAVRLAKNILDREDGGPQNHLLDCVELAEMVADLERDPTIVKEHRVLGDVLVKRNLDGLIVPIPPGPAITLTWEDWNSLMANSGQPGATEHTRSRHNYEVQVGRCSFSHCMWPTTVVDESSKQP